MGLLLGDAMPPKEAGVLLEPRSGFGGIFLKFQEKLIFFAKFRNKFPKELSGPLVVMMHHQGALPPI